MGKSNRERLVVSQTKQAVRSGNDYAALLDEIHSGVEGALRYKPRV